MLSPPSIPVTKAPPASPSLPAAPRTPTLESGLCMSCAGSADASCERRLLLLSVMSGNRSSRGPCAGGGSWPEARGTGVMLTEGAMSRCYTDTDTEPEPEVAAAGALVVLADRPEMIESSLRRFFSLPVDSSPWRTVREDVTGCNWKHTQPTGRKLAQHQLLYYIPQGAHRRPAQNSQQYVTLHYLS